MNWSVSLIKVDIFLNPLKDFINYFIYVDYSRAFTGSVLRLKVLEKIFIKIS